MGDPIYETQFRHRRCLVLAANLKAEIARLRDLVMRAAPTAWTHGADIDGAIAWEKEAAALISLNEHGDGDAKAED